MGGGRRIPTTAGANPGRFTARLILQPFRDLLGLLDRAVAGARHPLLAMALLLASATACWFLYVPAHELLHLVGCRLSGGEVRRLEISPLYGGRLLAGRIPAVEAGGDAAGRMTDFSTGRSDLRYLITDLAPYLLTLAGVPLLRLASRRRSALLGGITVLLAFAPFMSLGGDYYEIGSVLVTRAFRPLERPPDPGREPPGIFRLRSDDLGGLFVRIASEPEEFTRDLPGGGPVLYLAFALSAATGVILAFLTYGAGAAVDRLVGAGRRRAGPGGTG